MVCAAPVYLQRRGIPKDLADLEFHNCLTYAFFGKNLWTFTKNGESFRVPVKGNLTADDALVLLQAAVAGAGISFSPMMSAAPLIASGQLVMLLPDYNPEVLSIYGIYASRARLSATLRTMLDFLVEWLATPRGEVPALPD